MCRALLYLGELVLLDNLLFQRDSALIRPSYMPKMLHMRNLAGFGLHAGTRREPRNRKRHFWHRVPRAEITPDSPEPQQPDDSPP
jgi:hypothetical protein